MSDKLSTVMGQVASNIPSSDKNKPVVDKKAEAAKLAKRAESTKSTAADANQAMKEAAGAMQVSGPAVLATGTTQVDSGQLAGSLRAPLESLLNDTALMGKPDGGPIADSFSGGSLQETYQGELPSFTPASVSAFFTAIHSMPTAPANNPEQHQGQSGQGPVAQDDSGTATGAMNEHLDAAKDAAFAKFAKSIPIFDPKGTHAGQYKMAMQNQALLSKVFTPTLRALGLVPVASKLEKKGVGETPAQEPTEPTISDKEGTALGNLFSSTVALSGGGEPDLSKMDIDEAVNMVMFMCASQAEEELGDLIKDMQQRIHDKRIKRAEIQCRKEQMDRADSFLRDEYAQLQAEGLIDKGVTLEDYKKMRSVAWSEPVYDPKTDSVTMKEASLTEPSWVNEPNCIPPQMRPTVAENKEEGGNFINISPGLLGIGLATFSPPAYDPNDKVAVGANYGLPTNVTNDLFAWFSSDHQLKSQYKNFDDFLSKRFGLKGDADTLSEKSANRNRLESELTKDQTPPIYLGSGSKPPAPNTFPASIVTSLSAFAKAVPTDADLAAATGLPVATITDLRTIYEAAKKSDSYSVASTFEEFLFDKGAHNDVEHRSGVGLSDAQTPGSKAPNGDTVQSNAAAAAAVAARLANDGVPVPTGVQAHLETTLSSVTKNNDQTLADKYGLPVDMIKQMREMYNLEAKPGRNNFEDFLERGMPPKGNPGGLKAGGDPAANAAAAFKLFGDLAEKPANKTSLDLLKSQYQGKIKSNAPPTPEKPAAGTEALTGLPNEIYNAAKAAYDKSGLASSGMSFEEFLSKNLKKGLTPQQAGKAIADLLRDSCKAQPDAFTALQSFEQQMGTWTDGQDGAATGNSVNYNSKQTAPPGYEQTGSLQTMQNAVDKSKDQLDALGDLSELDQLRLQKLMDRRAKAMETISNLMKKVSGTAEKIIDNMK